MDLVPPLVSFGTYKIKGRAAYDATLSALSCGYRSIDTARCYGNEEEVGRALAASRICRSELFVTSKIAPWEMGEPDSAINASLAALRLDYLDLMLIHWPGKSKTAVSSPDNRIAREDCWRALRRAKAEGKCRAIGVSNFTVAHMQELLVLDGGPPSDLAVNQVERHPLYPQRELLEFCQARGITLQSYSPLGCGDARVLKHPALEALAEESQMPVADLLLLWQARQGIPLVVKSVSPSRIKSNWDCLSVASAERLDPETARKIDLIADEEKICWNPNQVL